MNRSNIGVGIFRIVAQQQCLMQQRDVIQRISNCRFFSSSPTATTTTTPASATKIDATAAATTTTTTKSLKVSKPPPSQDKVSEDSIQPQTWQESLELAWANAAGVNEISALKEKVDAAASLVDEKNRSVAHWRQQVQRDTTRAEQLAARHKQVMLLHREGTTLLTDSDIQQFAQLTADESKARVKATQSLQTLATAEKELHDAQIVYMDALRKRYHEEQVWQDKWRVLGTYWTWLLIGLNSVVFVAGQVMHWRREETRMKTIQAMLINDLPALITPQLLQEQLKLLEQEREKQTTTTEKTRNQEHAEESTETNDELVADVKTLVSSGASSGDNTGNDTLKSPPIHKESNEQTDRASWRQTAAHFCTQRIVQPLQSSLAALSLSSPDSPDRPPSTNQNSNTAISVATTAYHWSVDLVQDLHAPSMMVGAIVVLAVSNLFGSRSRP